MAMDVVDLRSFYASPLGAMTRRYLNRVVRGLWPDATGQSVAGIGYATPFLQPMRGEAERVLALMPAAQGVVNWPGDGLSATALIDPYEIPLPNASIDRILLVHALETVVTPRDMLDEAWRVLNPGGRLICIVPNRRGLWARMDTTPFGHGQPYSSGQLADLMRQALFSPETWREALFFPPLQRRMMLKTAPAWERIGQFLNLPFAGVHVVDATKQLYRPAPVRAQRRTILIAAPAPAAATREAHRTSTLTGR
ncbi:MAG: class I SAM-dependent methyltransferase [Beijerinckiaceae bacterium]